MESKQTGRYIIFKQNFALYALASMAKSVFCEVWSLYIVENGMYLNPKLVQIFFKKWKEIN